jgi:hypothetical protein
MIALAWKMLVWFGVGVALALGVLIVPLHVAAERKKLDATTTQVAQAERDIRALETEFETRANIAQLEKWNGDTLRLAAPVAGQYLRDEAALASLDFHAPLNAGGADVQMAAAIVPQQAVAPTASPAANPTAPVAMAALNNSVSAAPSATSATSATTSRAPTVRATAPIRTAVVARPRTQAVAMLDRKLLSDTMLGDLTSGASAEARRLR